MDQDLKNIINQLVEKTKAEKVNWQHSSYNEYRVVMNNAVVSVGISQGVGGTTFYYCSIFNNNGDLVLSSNSHVETEDGRFLKSFYCIVEDAYTGKKKVLGSIFSELEGNSTIGRPEEIDSLPF